LSYAPERDGFYHALLVASILSKEFVLQKTDWYTMIKVATPTDNIAFPRGLTIMNMPPEMLLNNRYRIERMLGQGGMGAVYLAFDISLDAPAAVKANQNPAPQSTNQFLREARLLASLRHPNLPRVTDYFILDNAQYLVMDYVAGKDLNTLLHEEGAQPLERVLGWARELCSVLSYLHHQNPTVIHRDVKPANVRLSPEGKVILVDFGIAKVFDPNQQATTTGAMGYTPGYAPPEQYGGSVRTGPYTDQYSLAALLYHLLTAQKPADSVQRAIGNTRLAPLSLLKPTIPTYIQAAIERALSLRPDDRFPSVDDFLIALTTPASVPTEQIAPTLLVARQPQVPANQAKVTRRTSEPTLVNAAVGGIAPNAAGRSLHGDLSSRIEMAIPTEALAPPRRGPNWLLVIGIGLLAIIGLGAAALLVGGLLLSRAGQPVPQVAAAIATAPEGAAPAAALPTDTSAPPTAAPTDTQAPAAAAAAASSPTTPSTDTLQPSPTPLPIGGGGVIAFASNRKGSKNTQIWTMRVALNDQGGMVTSDLKQITNTPSDKSQPAWSPDGKHLLYVAPGGHDKKLDIWMINPDGSGEPKDLTNMNGDETQPAWSPDGKWIAFTADKRSDKVLQIYLIRPDGSEAYRLSFDQEEYAPAWKPDNQLSFVMNTGKKIVFIRSQENPKPTPPPHEYYVTPYRFDMLSFTDNLGDAAQLSWSADGKWMAYTRVRGSSQNVSLAHYPIKVPAQDVLHLTDTGKDSGPNWSPDGQWIVFTSTRDGNPEVYIMQSTGQSQANLSSSAGVDKDPAWQPASP
jgi:eukaryotic-like serine/threonine-protein kinase